MTGVNGMRIVFVAPFGLRKKTTVWARTFPMARALVRQGHQATVLIPPWDSPQDAGRSWDEGGVRVVNVELSGGLPSIVLRLLNQIRAQRPHIVHVVKPRAYSGIVQWLLWYGRRLGGEGVRVVLDADDWEQAWAPIAGYSPWMAHFLAWQEEWGIRHADGVTVASQWLEQRVHLAKPGMPVLYLPNGIVEPEKDRPLSEVAGPGDATPEATVLWFSRFVEIDPDWMAAFWTALQEMSANVRLIVAGRALQPERESVFRQRLVSATQGPARLDWLGFVEPSELASMYAAADCAIFPAANVPLNQAKCSVRLATTLLNGVPVVASAVGEQTMYGADGAACLVPADASPEEFALAVARVVVDPAQRQTLSHEARERLLRHYDWGQLVQQLNDFYTRIGANPTAAP